MVSGSSQNDVIEDKTIPKKTGKKGKKVLKTVISLIIIVLIVITIIYLALIYQAASSVKIDPKKINGVKVISIQDYEVEFVLTLKNTANINVQVEKITYEVFIENDFLGKGEKLDFTIKSGTNDYIFSLGFNIFDLATAIRNQLLNSTSSIRINGQIFIPIKLLRMIKVGEVTGDYELVEDIGLI